MKYKIGFLLITGLLTGSLTFPWSAGAQGSREFQSHALQPPPMPSSEYLRKSGFYRFSSREVVSAFKQHDMEVKDLKPGFTVGAPGSEESVIFLMPSFGKNIGILVSSFSSEQNLQKSVQYYGKMKNKAGSPSWRIFIKDNILLLISGTVPEDTAEQYENVLSNMEQQ